MTSLNICLLQWEAYNKRMEKVITSLSDEAFQEPIVSGGNNPSWILGHLVDADDALLPLLGIGDRLYPDLGKIYHHEYPSNQSGHLGRAELLSRWKEVSARLSAAFSKWSEAEWMQRHTAVKEEDFAKEPHRNRLNVMLSRVSHKASHLGQISMGH